MSEDFYVYLMSNVNNKIGVKDNTISNFITYLPEKLELNEQYEVALADISYTKSWFNIENTEDIWVTDVDGNDLKSYKITLAAGYYNELMIIKSINAMINKHGLEDWISVNPQISFDEKAKKFQITYGATKEATSNPNIILPIFSYDLSEKLGFIDKKSEKLKPANYKDFCVLNDQGEKVGTLVGNFNPQINTIHSLYIYSDILNPRIVGNVKVPLFRQVEVPSDKRFGQDISIKYDNLFYHPLNHFEIDTILISIKDDTGSDIHFNFGRIALALHFRKRNKIRKCSKKIS